jgi:hypothetical protein
MTEHRRAGSERRRRGVMADWIGVAVTRGAVDWRHGGLEAWQHGGAEGLWR